MTQRCEIVQDLRGGTPGLESQSAFDRLLRQYFAIPPVRDFRAKVGESEEPGARILPHTLPDHNFVEQALA